jgi:hypothetical protein
VTLGGPEGWTRELAETELANVLADVRRGLWRDVDEPEEPGSVRAVPTFERFASGWLEDRQADSIRERTKAHHAWATGHLIDWFGRMRLDMIHIEAVDQFKRGKLAEGALGPNSVNRMIAELALILEYAIEAGHVSSNPAAGRRRRLRALRPALLPAGAAARTPWRGEGTLRRARWAAHRRARRRGPPDLGGARTRVA